MKRQSRPGFRLRNSDGNHRSRRSFSDRALPSTGSCHWDVHICSLPKFSGLQLSSLLKHMLNLQRNIFPRRGAQRFSANQADLTGRREHSLLRPSRHGCLKPFPRISQQGLLLLNQDRSHRTQSSRAAEKGCRCVPCDKSLSSLSPSLVRHRAVLRIHQGNTCEALSFMHGAG